MGRDKKIILFDGVCNLCNSSVFFIIKRDKGDVFRFAGLQSGIGLQLVKKHGIDTSKTDSIILIEDETHFTQSTAALKNSPAFIRRLSAALWFYNSACIYSRLVI